MLGSATHVEPPAPTLSRLDAHLLIVITILLTSAGLAVFSIRTLGLPEQMAVVSACAFAVVALLGHLVVSRLGAPPVHSKAQARSKRRSVKRDGAGTAVRSEPELPPPGSIAASDPGYNAPVLPTSPSASGDLPARQLPPNWQAELGRVMPAAAEDDLREPALPMAARSGSVVDENEVQRVEKLVRQLAENVRLLEQSSHPLEASRGRPTAAAAPAISPPAPVRYDDLGSQAAEPPPSIKIAAAVASTMTSSRPQLHLPPETAAPAMPPELPSYVPAAQPPPTFETADTGSPPPAIPAVTQRTAPYPAAQNSIAPGLSHAAPDFSGEREGIIAALNAQRIDVFLEPILAIRDQKPQHFEVSIGLRAADGTTIDLARVEEQLGGTGLLPLLDQTRIVQAANLAERLAERGKMGNVLTAMHGETLADEGFKRHFTNGDRSIGVFPGHLVLAFEQSQVMHFAAADWQTLSRLAGAGFSYAITSITTLDMDFQILRQRGFVMARLDAGTFLEGLPAEGGTIAPSDICRHLAGSGLSLVVGRIADEQQLARIFGFGVLFGQGQVFGGPRTVNPEARIRPAPKHPEGDDLSRPA